MTDCEGCTVRGMCCHFSVPVGGVLYVLPNHHCKYLGPDKLCTVYEKRFEVNPECSSMQRYAEFGGCLKECNYKNDYNWKYDKVEIASEELENVLIEFIRANRKFEHSR